MCPVIYHFGHSRIWGTCKRYNKCACTVYKKILSKIQGLLCSRASLCTSEGSGHRWNKFSLDEWSRYSIGVTRKILWILTNKGYFWICLFHHRDTTSNPSIYSYSWVDSSLRDDERIACSCSIWYRIFCQNTCICHRFGRERRERKWQKLYCLCRCRRASGNDHTSCEENRQEETHEKIKGLKPACR